jgi:hypothetical protein
VAKEHSGEERLAELTWRTVKLRVSLLVLTILSLLIVWSALTGGDKQAREIDIKFCQQLIGESNERMQGNLETEVWCTPDGARNYVEGKRSANQIILMGSEALEESNKEAADKLLKQYVETNKVFAEYDAKRRAAYPLQIQLSSEYSGGHVILNGRFVAQLLPFCVLIVLSVVVLLGFQQKVYQHQLSSLLSESHDEQDRELRIARGQFFAGIVQGRSSTISSYLVLSPERLATGTLYLFSLTLFFCVLFAYISKLVNLTDSVFFSYPCAVLVAVFVLTFWLSRTRRHYTQFYRPMARVTQVGHRIAMLRRTHWLKIVLVVVGIVSLVLPWASGPGFHGNFLRGFRFLLRQPILNQVGDVIFVPIDPSIFLEIRIQVAVALLFLLVCGLSGGLELRGNKWHSTPFQKAQKMLAILVLFLSMNYLLYMAILESGGVLEDNPFLSQWVSKAHGMPMSLYDPSYGFVIF